MKEFKVISLYFFLIVNLFSGLHLEAKSIVSGDIVEGQAYQPNFLKQKGHFEKNANGTTAYADAAGTRPLDGSGGTPTLSCTRTTSSPIDGDGSLLITKDAANRQGNGCTIQFTIDSAYKAKVLQIEFDYLVASGTFTAGSSSADSDLIVYIYDVTNSTLIEPSSIKLLSNSTTISDHFIANFQTSATGTTYNLILHQATTSASAYTVKADNFEVKPSQYVYGTPITDWTSYTPSNTQGLGTITSVNLKWRRVGDSMQIQGGFATGTVTGSTAQLGLPSGSTIGGTTSSRMYAGETIRNGGSRVTNFAIQGATYLTFGAGAASHGDVIGSSLFGSSEQLYITAFDIPIAGWSSSTQVSDGYDGRLIAASYQASSGQSITSTAVITMMGTKLYDTTNSYNTATGVYTVPSAGKYRVTGNFVTITSTSVPNSLNIRKNSSAIFRLTPSYVNTANNYVWTGSGIIDANAGDTIDFQILAGGAGTFYNSGVDNWFTIEKLSSPQTMSATERVSASYNTSAGQSISTSTVTIVDFGTKLEDSHGAVTTGASWKFVAPVAGEYQVNAGVLIAGGNSLPAGNECNLALLKNGTDYKVLEAHYGQTASTASISLTGAAKVKLNAGEYFDIRVYQTTGSTSTLINQSRFNYVDVFLVK